MEAKHWFGIVVLGAILMGVSFAINDSKKPGDVPGARPLSEGLAESVEVPKPVKAPKVEAPKPPAPEVEGEAEQPAQAGGEPVAAGGEPETGGGKPVAPAAPLRTFGADGPAIAGRVLWDGPVRPNPVVRMSSDPVCNALHQEEVRMPYVAKDDNDNLANVIVYVKDVPKGNYPVRQEPVILDQEGCMYHPHVVGIQIGQEVIIRNSDATTHNVHFKSRLNGDWNQTQPTKGDIKPKGDFARAEVGTTLFKCDIHPWMEARVGIFEHPFFAVSKEDGTFEIPKGLPDGTYELEAWHEKSKTASVKVDVKSGQTAQVQFTFNLARKNKGVVVGN